MSRVKFPRKGFQSQTLAQTGELALLKRICRRLPLRRDVLVGAGDDCAVVRPASAGSYDYLLKSDGIVEGVHFQPDTRPELIGHKAVGRVFSDIAAMGGEPLWILVDLSAPGKTPVGRIDGIYAGMLKLAKLFNVAMVGGDVTSGKELQLHVFGVGRVKKDRAARRSGAGTGDAIFVTGCLGGSLAGKHLNFTPRLREGQWLVNGQWPSAMIDISDGLLRDLGHVISSGRVGARLALDAVPVSAAAQKVAGAKNALKHALADGEDYELLFTVPAKKVKAFEKAWQRKFKLLCSRIGAITSRGSHLKGLDASGGKIKLNAIGYEHFR